MWVSAWGGEGGTWFLKEANREFEPCLPQQLFHTKRHSHTYIRMTVNWQTLPTGCCTLVNNNNQTMDEQTVGRGASTFESSRLINGRSSLQVSFAVYYFFHIPHPQKYSFLFLSHTSCVDCWNSNSSCVLSPSSGNIVPKYSHDRSLLPQTPVSVFFLCLVLWLCYPTFLPSNFPRVCPTTVLFDMTHHTFPAPSSAKGRGRRGGARGK